MNPVKVFIVEDKSAVAENIARAVEKAGYTVCGRSRSGEDALVKIKEEKPDVVLMDIHLSGKLDGIQTVEFLNKQYPVPVIYLTDYGDNYTIDRAKLTNPVNYLVKPFTEKTLLIAIEIAFYNASTGKKPDPARQEEIPAQSIFPLVDRFFIKENGMIWRIDVADILWIEADGSYYKIRTSKRTYHQVGNLTMFNEKYEHPLLVRVHRSYIVNIDKIIGVKGNQVLIEGAEEEIPISNSYRAQLPKHLHII
jgi:DNA-binding LytR/AlgR family response regulator